MFIIIVKDEGTTDRIVDQVLWAVINKYFSVKRWSSDLSLDMEISDRRLATEVGEFSEVESLVHARGFLKARILVDTINPMVTWC